MDKLSPDTPIIGIHNRTVCDFWSWAYSDILSNRNRGIFAEYIVACALSDDNTVRTEWDGWDCMYRGQPIEVKCSAYVQGWKQEKLSNISFDIAKKRSWYAESNTYADTSERHAFCYVFSLLATKDTQAVNVLDMSQWQFYVMKTSEINERFGNQKSISLSVLSRYSKPVGYCEIKATIDQLMP